MNYISNSENGLFLLNFAHRKVKYEQNGAMINVRCYALEGERKGQTTEGKGSEISFEKTY